MEGFRVDVTCPNCRTRAIPIIVVRGTGTVGTGLSLRCRNCHREWTDEQSPYGQAS